MSSARDGWGLRRVTDDRPLLIVGTAAPIAMRHLPAAGVDALWLGSLEMSTQMAVADANGLGPEEYEWFVQAARRASVLPILLDLENGPEEASATVALLERLEGLGVAAVALEDSRWPRRNTYGSAGRQIQPVEGAAERLELTRAHCGATVVARTEALFAGVSEADCVARCRTYCDAGADAVLIHCKTARHLDLARDIRTVVAAPVGVLASPFEGSSIDSLFFASLDFVVFASELLRSQTHAAIHRLSSIAGQRIGSDFAAEQAPDITAFVRALDSLHFQ